jgi:hypothetical protein
VREIVAPRYQQSELQRRSDFRAIGAQKRFDELGIENIPLITTVFQRDRWRQRVQAKARCRIARSRFHDT